jgi:hypothetical protein
VKRLGAIALVVSACSDPELAREGDRELCHRWVAVAAEHLAACGADASALDVWITSRGEKCERLLFVNPIAASPEQCIQEIAGIPCDQIRRAAVPIPWCPSFVTGET